MTVQGLCTTQPFLQVLRKLKVIAREENLMLKASSQRTNSELLSVLTES